MGARPPRTPRTPKNARANQRRDWTAAFLAALRDTGLVTEACRAAKVGRSTVYEHRQSDEAFAAAWQQVDDEVTDELEREARRRAAEGTLKPVFHQGMECGAIREFSDTLLIFLLKARKPATYRDNVKLEHTGEGGGPVVIDVLGGRDPVELSRKLRREIAKELAGKD